MEQGAFTDLFATRHIGMTNKEYKQARKELLPAELDPSIEKFLVENGFKDVGIPDDARAKILIILSKMLDERLDLLAWYVNNENWVNVLVGKNFSVVGGIINLEDNEQNSKFFSRFVGRPYHIFDFFGVKMYLNDKRARNVEELKNLIQDAVEINELHERVENMNSIIDAEMEPNAHVVISKGLHDKDTTSEKTYDRKRSVYRPDDETLEFLKGWVATPLFNWFAEYLLEKLLGGKFEVTASYSDPANHIHFARTGGEWRVFCKILINPLETRNREFIDELEGKNTPIREFVFRLMGDEMIHAIYYALKGKASNLEELKELYKEALSYQKRQVEMIAKRQLSF